MKAVEKRDFGQLADGTQVDLYVLENDNGDRVELSPYGATLVALKFNDDGDRHNIVLGYDDVSAYEQNGFNLGATVGPYANRIRSGEFRLNQKFYRIKKNDGNNVVHSGELGFDKKLWRTEIVKDHLVKFAISLKSPSYPGEIEASVSYSFANDRQLEIKYEASSSESTYLNFTNHSYFNLAGTGDVSEQFLAVNADFYTPVDTDLMPTGEILSVQGSDFDLRKLTKLEKIFASTSQSISTVGGLDHNFVLNKEEPRELTYAARLVDKSSKKQLVCYTDLPGIQIFTANGLPAYTGSEDRVFSNHYAVCLETQFFPDSPNIPYFVSPLLKAGEKFTSTTIYSYVPWTEDIEASLAELL